MISTKNPHSTGNRLQSARILITAPFNRDRSAPASGRPGTAIRQRGRGSPAYPTCFYTRQLDPDTEFPAHAGRDDPIRPWPRLRPRWLLAAAERADDGDVQDADVGDVSRPRRREILLIHRWRRQSGPHGQTPKVGSPSTSFGRSEVANLITLPEPFLAHMPQMQSPTDRRHRRRGTQASGHRCGERRHRAAGPSRTHHPRADTRPALRCGRIVGTAQLK